MMRGAVEGGALRRLLSRSELEHFSPESCSCGLLRVCGVAECSAEGAGEGVAKGGAEEAAEG
eukprot:7173099-Alexandrium_andersonii.AAC.1